MWLCHCLPGKTKNPCDIVSQVIIHVATRTVAARTCASYRLVAPPLGVLAPSSSCWRPMTRLASLTALRASSAAVRLTTDVSRCCGSVTGIKTAATAPMNQMTVVSSPSLTLK